MKKRIYRATPVKALDLTDLAAELVGQRLIFGIDVAKGLMYATLMSLEETILAVVRWDHLRETASVVSWLCELDVEVALEPSGTYADTLRHALEQAGVPVYRVSPKQVKDAREIYDGVPSSHDAKSSATVAWLHCVGRSERWLASSSSVRTLRAGVQRLELHQSALGPALNRLEAQLTRYWPELLELLDLDSATLLELISTFGTPAAVAADPRAARALMQRVGGNFLKQEKIEQVLASAASSLGVAMVAGERGALRDLAAETRRRHQLVQAAKKRLEVLCLDDEPLARVGEVVGRSTSAVLTCRLGPLPGYASAGSLLKAPGLNLKEISSGRRQGQLGITKRGSRQVRQYLYLAVLRWIQKDPWARAWYEKKLQRDGGKLKRKAVVALMRKLLVGLWWVARGEAFDSTKLFDTRRLEPSTLESVAAASATS
jgi:transposase